MEFQIHLAKGTRCRDYEFKHLSPHIKIEQMETQSFSKTRSNRRDEVMGWKLQYLDVGIRRICFHARVRNLTEGEGLSTTIFKIIQNDICERSSINALTIVPHHIDLEDNSTMVDEFLTTLNIYLEPLCYVHGSNQLACPYHIRSTYPI